MIKFFGRFQDQSSAKMTMKQVCIQVDRLISSKRLGSKGKLPEYHTSGLQLYFSLQVEYIDWNSDKARKPPRSLGPIERG